MGISKDKQNKRAILLSDVATLTLRGHGAKTTNRRVSAIPQLRCVSRQSLCRLVDDEVELMRCTNQGSSYGDEEVEWSCTASLPEGVRLGSTDVICEGYSGPDDPYILKGSCGVEYTIALTPKGEAMYPHLEAESGSGDAVASLMSAAFIVLFVAVLGWIIYSGCTAYQANNRRRPAYRQGGGGGGGGGWGGGGGGGGGDGPGWDPRFGRPWDNDDPPPPYPGRKTSSNSRQTSSNSGQTGWRPGFWSGLAGGAAAAYAARNMGRNRDNDRNDYSPPVARRGGSSSYSSSSSSAGPSGTAHESTGFGSTRRR